MSIECLDFTGKQAVFDRFRMMDLINNIARLFVSFNTIITSNANPLILNRKQLKFVLLDAKLLLAFLA